MHPPRRDARCLLRLSRADRALRVDWVVVPGHRGMPVSFQPATVERAVRDAAHEARALPGEWCRALIAHLLALDWDIGWRPDEDPDAEHHTLTASVGGMTHPLLGHAYDAGARPVGEIPRWATDVLARCLPGSAAKRAFGAASSRRVARALAASLVPPDGAPRGAQVALAPLAWALAAGTRCEPDHLVRILEARTPWHPPSRWPSVDDLDTMKAGLACLPVPRAVQLAVEAASAVDQARAVSTLALLAQAQHLLVPPLPAGLDELRLACLRVLPRLALTDHELAAVNRSRTAHRVRVPDDALPPPPVAAVELAPAFAHPNVLRRVDGVEMGEVRLALPRGPSELATWGELLVCCLADYAAAVHAGRSWLIGVEHRGALNACIEIEPASRRIRQFLTIGNRPVPAHVRIPVVRALHTRGLAR